MMTPNEHQLNCLKTMAGFGSKEEQIAFGASLAAGEAGELLNIANKVHYQGHPLDEHKREKLIEEAGDTIWGLCVALAGANIGLDDCIPGQSMLSQPFGPEDKRLAHGAAIAVVQAARLLAVANGVFYEANPVDNFIRIELKHWARLTLCGLTMVLDVAGCSLGACMAANREKLAKRYGGAFSTAASLARVDVREKVGAEVTRGTPVPATTFRQRRVRGVTVIEDTRKAPTHS